MTVKTLPIGERLGGGHVIKDVLGQGGFGVTYKVQSPAGEMLAMKEYCPRNLVTRTGSTLVINPTAKKEFRLGYRLFKREAETLRDLAPHPHIVGVRGLFEKNETIYMVMDFVAGQPLQDMLVRGKQLSDREVLNLLGQTTVALGFLHDNHVLHCDIKPHNIMIRESDASAVVIDFGAVRDLTNKSERVEVFTESYAPIEIVDRELGEIGPWSDIYSLGAVGYFLITGAKPASAVDRAKAMAKGAPDPYRSAMSTRRSGVSEALASVVDLCLRFDPSERPLNADALLSLLQGRRAAAASASEHYGKPRSIGIGQIARSVRVIQVVANAAPASRGATNQASPPPPQRGAHLSAPEPRFSVSELSGSDNRKVVNAILIFLIVLLVGVIGYALLYDNL